MIVKFMSFMCLADILKMKQITKKQPIGFKSVGNIILQKKSKEGKIISVTKSNPLSGLHIYRNIFLK